MAQHYREVENTITELLGLLEGVPARRMRKTLVRCVALEALMEDGEPDFLFTSGKRDRFNLEGVGCIYFAEDEETARAEHRCQDEPRTFHPVCTFFAAVVLDVLDLSDKVIRHKLGFSEKELRAPWERVQRPTRSQLLGTALSQHRQMAAIQYPSDAARAHGFAGYNVVIFRKSVRRPNYVRVLGPGKKPLQSWP